jgi:hypothetical protein
MKLRWRRGFYSQQGHVFFSQVHPTNAQPVSNTEDSMAGLKLNYRSFLVVGILPRSRRVWIEVLTSVKIFILVFCVIKSCGSVVWFQHFGGTCSLYFQGTTQFLKPRKFDCFIYWTPSSKCLCSMRAPPSDRYTIIDQFRVCFSVQTLVVLTEGFVFVLIRGRQRLGLFFKQTKTASCHTVSISSSTL